MSEKILVVDDEDIIRNSLSYILKNEGYDVEEAANGLEALNRIKEEPFDIVVSDIEMPVMRGIELLEHLQTVSPETSVIIVTAYGSLDTAIRALRGGASDYILKPVEFDELLIKIKRIIENRRILNENKLLKKEIQRKYDFENLVGKSKPMKNVFEMISMVADTDSTVLITGNSGTGKELIARAIHFSSKRKNKPFVAVNCGAISENLIESELFGHKKGAFTGAISDKEGFLKAAEGGTLFLDEISEMPLQLQVKLLRVIQEKEYIPVGTTQPIPINLRFLASTNRNLKEEVTKNTFREDLYYRLNVVEIHLPSLKERKDDIPYLIDHFINKYRLEMGKKIQSVDAQALRALMNYEWKGEIRELENVIERAIIFCKREMITIENLPDFMQDRFTFQNAQTETSLEEFVAKVEKDYILRTLEENDYDKEKVAKILKLGLSTLYRKIKELEIDA